MVTSMKTDTGSPQVQLVNFRTKMLHIAEHLKKHPKDKSARYGLINVTQKYVRMKKYINSYQTNNG